MNKRSLLLSTLLTLVILFPMTAFAAEGMQESIEIQDGFELIRGGTFQMGSPICTNLIKILAFVAALFFVFQQKNPQNRLKMHPQRED